MNNMMPQQSNFYQNQQSFVTPEQYEPIGNVQSHYQGQLSQPTFGRQTESIVQSPINNYQQSFSGSMQYAAPSQSYGMQQQGFSNANTFASHQPVQSHASSPATAFGNVGPVIAHFGGYQANSNASFQPSNYRGMNQSQQFSSNAQSFNNFSGQGQGYGMTQTYSQTGENPVYQATNAYEQAGPVISRYGWQSAPGNR